MRARSIVNDILRDHEPIAPCVADCGTDLAHDSAQDLLNFLVNTLVRPQFTGTEGCAKAPLRSEHDTELCHESVLELGTPIGSHERGHSSAAKHTPNKSPSHLSVRQGMHRLQKNRMAKAVEESEGIPVTFSVLPVRALTIHTDLLPTRLGAALDCTRFDLRRTRPAFDAGQALADPGGNVLSKVGPPHSPLKELS